MVSDEIYEKLVYGGEKHISIASLPGMKERTITLNGFSKCYSMTGWRLGYAAAPVEFIKAMVRVHQYINTCAASFVQEVEASPPWRRPSLTCRRWCRSTPAAETIWSPPSTASTA